MSPTALVLLIVLAGIVTVIGSILLFRLHAFLALVLGALVVAMLTPRTNLQNYFVEDAAVKIVESTENGLWIKASPADYPVGSTWLIVRRSPESGGYEEVGRLISNPPVTPLSLADEQKQEPQEFMRAIGNSIGNSASLLAVHGPGSISPLNWNSKIDSASLQRDDKLMTSENFTAAKKASRKNLGSKIAEAFGSTAGKIGILIAMASIIGKCLLDSGAADRIVRSTLSRFGEERAPVAFLFSGFLLAIPVFFDTVFYLMIPLGKALRLRTGKNYLLYVLTIVAGGTMAHSLVPPTPGPLFVAEELGVSIGTMILAGCGVGLCTSTVGLFWAHFVNRRNELPLRDTPDISLADLEKLSSRDESSLPPLGLSLLPILLPVFLIGGVTILGDAIDRFPEWLATIVTTLGDKNIALVIAAAIAVAILLRQTSVTRDEFAASMQSSLAGGGVIILITSAGGAFGQMLKMTGVATLVQDLPVDSPLVVLLLAFLITTAIRTAQGSSTVAMITAVGLFAPIVAGGDLGLHPVYVALAIGCGSKPLAWMNDSGFWVITRMSGMTEKEGLKYITPLSAAMGISGLVVTVIAASVYPGV